MQALVGAQKFLPGLVPLLQLQDELLIQLILASNHPAPIIVIRTKRTEAPLLHMQPS